MAQLVRIGPNKRNKAKETSKAYGIHRIGRETFQVWGPAQSLGLRFYWVSSHGGPQRSETTEHPTIEAAQAYVTKMLNVRRRHGYEPLEKGDRIRKGSR
jgi:hypothetical protein